MSDKKKKKKNQEKLLTICLLYDQEEFCQNNIGACRDREIMTKPMKFAFGLEVLFS